MFWLSFLLLFETSLGAEWENLMNSGSMNGYFTYNQYFQFVNDNLVQFKDHFTIQSAGKTSQNQNEIEYVKLSVEGEVYLDGVVESLRSAVMITAGQVTSQPLAVTMTLYILSRLLNDFETKPDVQMLLQSMDLYIVPMINVDRWKQVETEFEGSQEIAVYQTNSYAYDDSCPEIGVNLNRNYEVPSEEPINSQTCTNEYGGPAFFSESEASAMRALLHSSKARMWIHFDGLGNKFYVPYSYSTEPFESTLKAADTSFYKTLQSLSSKNAQMGTYKQLGNDAEVGLLIDYAYSKGVISLEVALESSVVARDDILDSVEGYYSYIQDILKYSSFKLNSLEYNDMSENVCAATYVCGDSDAYSEAVIKFDISNAGLNDTPQGRFVLRLEFSNEGYSLMIDDLVLYTWDINDTSFSPTNAKKTEYTVTCDQAQSNFISCGVSNMKLGARTQNTIEVKMSSYKTSSSTDQEIQFLYTASFSISYSANSKLATSSYSADDTLLLPSTAYTDSDSSEEDTEDSNDDFLPWDVSRMPRHSGNHIEGVAVGLIAGFMSIVFLLIAGLIFYKFRKEIAQDESSDEEEVDHNMKNTFIPQSDQIAAPGYSGADISAKMIENARKDIPSLRLNSTNREVSINGSPERLNISPVRDSPIAVNLNSDSIEEVEIDEIRFEAGS